MPNYTAVLSNKAKKQLDKLTDKIAEPIIDAIATWKLIPGRWVIKNLKTGLVCVLGLVITELFMRFLKGSF